MKSAESPRYAWRSLGGLRPRAEYVVPSRAERYVLRADREPDGTWACSLLRYQSTQRAGRPILRFGGSPAVPSDSYAHHAACGRRRASLLPLRGLLDG